MTFEMYSNKCKLEFLLLAITLGVIAYFGASKIDNSLAIFLSVTIVLALVRPIILSKKVTIDSRQRKLKLSRSVLGFRLNDQYVDISGFGGIRNRIAWGYYKRSQTELVNDSGQCLAVRIEPLKTYISLEATEFKHSVARYAGLELEADMQW